MTDQKRWAELVADFDRKHQAACNCQLFDGGLLQQDRLPEYERLHAEREAAKSRMDQFIGAALAGLKL